MVHLVALKTKKDLCLGKILRTEDDKIFDFGLSESEGDDYELKSIIYQFIMDNVFNDVRLMTDKEYYEMDLSEFETVNKDYGMDFLNPNAKKNLPPSS